MCNLYSLVSNITKRSLYEYPPARKYIRFCTSILPRTLVETTITPLYQYLHIHTNTMILRDELILNHFKQSFIDQPFALLSWQTFISCFCIASSTFISQSKVYAIISINNSRQGTHGNHFNSHSAPFHYLQCS